MDQLQRYVTPANAWLWLLGLMALMFLPVLGATEFFSKGEPREAIVAVTMLDSGNWILPVSNGNVIPYKPPMLAWCVAAVSWLAGGVSEWTSRFPSAVALMAMVMLCFSFWRRRVGVWRALAASVLTFTFFEVYRAALACRVDMLLTFFIVGAVIKLFEWSERDWKGVPVWGVLLMSGAVLSKGPVGMVLPCAAVWVAGMATGRGAWAGMWRLALAGLVSLVIPAMWYVAAWTRGGEEFLDLVMEENFGRFTGTMSYNSHVNPWHYNLISLLAGCAPYTLMALLGGCAAMAARKHSRLRGVWRRFMALDPARKLAVVAAVVVLVFYTVPKSKRSVYLLPMYPFMGLMMADCLMWMTRSAVRWLRAYTAVIAVVACIGAVAFVALQSGLGDIAARFHSDAVAGLAAWPGVWAWITVALSVTAAVYALRSLRRPDGRDAAAVALGVTAALYLAFGAAYQPGSVKLLSDKTIADHLESMAPGATYYGHVEAPMMRFFTANFYTHDRIKPFEETMPDMGLLVVGERDAAKLMARHEGDYRMVEMWSSPRRGCDVRQIIKIYSFKKTGQL